MLFALSEMSCRPETVDGFLAIVRLEFAMRRALDGHLGTRVGRSLSDPTRLVVFEQWTSAAAFHRYLANPRAAAFAAAIPPAVVSGQLHLLSAARIVDSAQATSPPSPTSEAHRPCMFLYEDTVGDPEAFREGMVELQACARGQPGFLFAYDAVDVSAPAEMFGAVAWQNADSMRAALSDPAIVAGQQRLAALATGRPRFRAVHSSAWEMQSYPLDAGRPSPQRQAAAAA